MDGWLIFSRKHGFRIGFSKQRERDILPMVHGFKSINDISSLVKNQPTSHEVCLHPGIIGLFYACDGSVMAVGSTTEPGMLCDPEKQ